MVLLLSPNTLSNPKWSAQTHVPKNTSWTQYTHTYLLTVEIIEEAINEREWEVRDTGVGRVCKVETVNEYSRNSSKKST